MTSCGKVDEKSTSLTVQSSSTALAFELPAETVG